MIDILPDVQGGRQHTTEVTPVMTFRSDGTPTDGVSLTAEEHAVRDRRAFSGSTGVQSVAAGNVMIVTIKNPIDSGKEIHITRRLFGNNVPDTGDNLEYVAYAGPAYEPANTANGVNLNGGTPFSSAELKWEVRPLAGLDVGGIQGTGEPLPRGEPYVRPLYAVFPQGSGGAFVIKGQGNNIGQAVRLSLILEWYEEDVA